MAWSRYDGRFPGSPWLSLFHAIQANRVLVANPFGKWQDDHNYGVYRYVATRCCTGNRLSQIMTRAFKDSSAFASGTKPGGDGTAAKTSAEVRESGPLAALRDSPFPKLVASELRVSDSDGAAEVFV